MSALTDYIPISTYLASEIGTQYGLKGENKTVINDGVALAAEGEGGCVNCEAACAGTCTAACAGGCAGSCVSACATACASNCTGTCRGSCTGTCTGSCTGTCSSSCTGSCASTCTGSCVGDCTGNCAGTCTNQCETYCAGFCQTYCQFQQFYSQNHGPNNPGGKIFTWSTLVDHDETIVIKAEDWNLLAFYVEQAAPFCSTSTVSLNRVAPLDFITAAIFNNLDGGIGAINISIGTKQKDIDFIKDEEINALATNYNTARMRDILPLTNGQVSGKCCQRGESCMTQASGRPSLQPCLKGQVCSQTCTQSPGSSL